MVLQGQKQFGNKWKDISSFLINKKRTPSSVKVRWHFLDRQIKKYGSTSEGLPNYPHIAYSFTKPVLSSMDPEQCTADVMPGSSASATGGTDDVGGTRGTEPVPMTTSKSSASSESGRIVEQQPDRQTSTATPTPEHPFNPHHMMPFGHYAHLHAQAEAQGHGMPAFMTAGPHGAMYMMVGGYVLLACLCLFRYDTCRSLHTMCSLISHCLPFPCDVIIFYFE